jgi:hypothetical protein
MSHLSESGKSAVAAASALRESATRLRRGTDAFLKRLFVQGYYLEKSFCEICVDCSAEEFGTYLYAVCLLSSVRADSTHFPLGQERIVNSGNVSKSKLRALPKRMRVVADAIDSLNATILNPANDITLMPPDAQRQIARDYMIRRYETLPGLLRFYSWHLERFSKSAVQSLKRLTFGHVLAVELVRYVEDHTGTPHYEDLSNLLEQGWLVVGKTGSVPSFLSTEGLAKLYQRWGDDVCGPRCTPTSRRARAKRSKRGA